MPAAALIFGNNQESGDQQLAGASPLAVNVLVDGKGAVRRRPGISTWDGFPATAPVESEITGITAFGGKVYWVNARREVYELDADTAAATYLSTGGATTYLAGTERPAFAETQFRLVIAGGAEPQKVEQDSSGVSSTDRLGGSPPDCSSVIAMSSRMFINDLTDASTTGRIRFSGVGDAGNESFDDLDVVTAEARPDPIVALRENTNEAWAFGSTNCQIFVPDGLTVLAPSRTMNRGCAAGASVLLAEDSFFWLDQFKDFVTSSGRGDEVISNAVSETLSQITTVSDCWGFRYKSGQFDSLQWLFPSDGRTFAYQKGAAWGQWHGWTDGAGHSVFPATAAYYWADENLHLVGTSDGRIAMLDSTATTDLGARIKAEVLTGFLNQGTDAIKSADVMRLTIKRGETAASSTEPVLLLSWRDRLGAFCSPVRIGLGTAGDDVFTVEKRTLGMYRRRQWKIEFSDAADFVLASAELTWSPGGSN